MPRAVFNDPNKNTRHSNRFLEDGSVVSSANCEPLDIQPELGEHGYHVECHPGIELAEMMERHEALLASVQQQTGVTVRSIPAARWREYFHYHNRRFGEIKFLIGKATAALEVAAATEG